MSRPREGLGEKVAATIRSQHLGSVADMLSDPTCVAMGFSNFHQDLFEKK